MEDYGNNFVVLTDEDGVETEFEHIDSIEYKDDTYVVLVPAEMVLEEEAEVVILKIEEEKGEEVLVSVDNEATLQAVFDLAVKRMEEAEDAEDAE